MNFLKFKSIVFGLIAVYAVTALLTSCERDTLNNLEEEVTLQKAELEVEHNAEENIESRGGSWISWRYKPSDLHNGSNFMRVNYCIDKSGIVMAQIFNCNWKLIGQSYQNVNSGCGSTPLWVKALENCSNNNHIQVKLLDRNWKEMQRVTTTVHRR